MNYWKRKKVLEEQQLNFEKSRLDYCKNLYKQEVDRRSFIERKSQFYLSFITLLLGAVFLKLETLGFIQDLLASKPSSHIYFIYFSIFGLGVSILTSLIGIIQSMRVEQYISPSEKNMTYKMFGPTPNYKHELDLLKEVAKMYLIAAEASRRISDVKAQWIKIASLSSLVAVLFLATLLGEIFYLTLNNTLPETPDTTETLCCWSFSQPHRLSLVFMVNFLVKVIYLIHDGI